VDFKLSAVKLSRLGSAQAQYVAEAPDIHPFMLSRKRNGASRLEVFLGDKSG
jgi:hypothetical protein